MATLHDRMRVILDEEAAALWLDHDIEDAEQLLPLLALYPNGELESLPVDKMVGSSKNELPQCVVPL